MGHTYINEQVNINEIPALDVEHLAADGKQISLGDLHASSLKLLYALVRHGFLNISEKDYSKFSKLYYKESQYTKSDIDEVRRIIAQAQVNPAAQNAMLTLIGDLIADRGKNDYFVLLLLKKLRDNHIPVDILISNHDAEFIRLYEKKFNANKTQSHFDESLLGEQAQSATNLQTLINNGIVSHEEVADLVESSYKPSLKAISYSYDKEADKITIYSHGKIDCENIQNMANKLGTTFYGTKPAELARTIDQINVAFEKHVRTNTVSDLINIDKLSQNEINFGTMDPKAFPFAHLIWNRKTANLNRNVPNVYFVHGHDSQDPTAANVFNLDNILSKLPLARFGIGIYNVLCTSTVSPVLSARHPVEVEVEEKTTQENDVIASEWTDVSSSQTDLSQSIVIDNSESSTAAPQGYFGSLVSFGSAVSNVGSWLFKSTATQAKPMPIKTQDDTPTVTKKIDTAGLKVIENYLATHEETAHSLALKDNGPMNARQFSQPFEGITDLSQSIVLDTEENPTFESLAPEGMVYCDKYGAPITGAFDMQKSVRLLKREDVVKPASSETQQRTFCIGS